MNEEGREKENYYSHDLIKEAQENIEVVYVNEFTEESYKDFRESFLKAEKTGQTLIPIVIDSYGGTIHSLLSMLDLINTSKLPVATIATGKAMSCGSVLLSAGTKGMRYASPYCTVMIHEASSAMWGKNADIQADAKQLERLNDVLFEILDKNCDKQLGYWKSHLKENKNSDLYYTAEQVKSHGLIDVVGSPRIEAVIKVETKLVV